MSKKTKRFYIIHKLYQGDSQWTAHASGLFSMFGYFPDVDRVDGAISFSSADHCEGKLRKVVAAKGFKPQIVRIIDI